MPSSRASAPGAALTTSPASPDAPQGHASGSALMVVGATSGAGKSTVVSALCRALARRGDHLLQLASTAVPVQEEPGW